MVRLSPRLRPMWPYLKPAYTQATRMVAPVSVRASQLRGGYLPSGYVESMEEAAATTGGRCLTVRPPEMLTRTVPKEIADRSADYVPWLSEHVRRVAVAELPHGRVLSPHNAVITGNDDLLVEVSLYFGTSRAREHPIFLHPFPGMPLEVGGRLGLLAMQGDTNYYHFMVDVLPRLGVLEQCPAVAPPDLWYTPKSTPVQRELLERMGIDLERVIDSAETRHVVAETLVVPSPAAMTIVNPPWVVEFLRRKLLPLQAKRIEGRGIYVTRGAAMNNRRVDNEPELMDYLGRRGFDMVDPGKLSALEQIETFAQASMIVGAAQCRARQPDVRRARCGRGRALSRRWRQHLLLEAGPVRARPRVPLRPRHGRSRTGVAFGVPRERHSGRHPGDRQDARRPRLDHVALLPQSFPAASMHPVSVARTSLAVRAQVNSDACFTPRSMSSALCDRAKGTARASAAASHPSMTVASPPVTSKSAGSGVTTTGMPSRIASSAGRPNPS